MTGVVQTLFAMAGLLALVSVLQPLAERVKLPFTVLLAFAGVLLGTASRLHDGIEMGLLSDFLGALAGFELSSQAFLYIFLPVLLFEMTLAIDVRRLLDDLAPILLLAVIAVLVSTFVVALALWQVAPVGLIACLVLSAIVATTDPTAVIAIFRDLGAPRRLTMLVEGESLLNDAAAIVLFTLFLGMLVGARETGVAAGILAFGQSFAGGLSAGYVFGRLLCWLVKPLQDQPLSEVTLTVAFAYLSFIVSQHSLGVSGVVAVVTTALVTGSVGRTRLSPEAWHAMETVWRQLGFWGSSMIFLFASMLVPPILVAVRGWELVVLAVLVVGALGARAIVLFGLMPLLSRAGYGQQVSTPYKAVILWGGLRGAVSLALALSLTENPAVPEAVAHFIVVQATGFVLFTLLVKGTTLRILLRLLGLDQLSPVDRAIRHRAMGLSLASIRDHVKAVARDEQIPPDVVERSLHPYDQRLDALDKAVAAEPRLDLDSGTHVGLAILVIREEEAYLDHFKQGVVGRPVVEVLTERVSWLYDGLKTGGRDGYETQARRALGFSRHFLWAMRLQRRLGLRGPLAFRLSVRYEALLVNRMVLRALSVFTRQRLAPLLGPTVGRALNDILEARLRLVQDALMALMARYPDYAPVLQHQHLGRIALRQELVEYEIMHSESLISTEVFDDLRRSVRIRTRALEQPPQLNLGLAATELIDRVPLFHGIGAVRLGELAKLLRVRLALPGEVLLRRGDRGGTMFFIAAGAVRVTAPGLHGEIDLGSGDFFGELALLTRQPRTADVVSLGYCHLLELDEPDFRRLIEADAALRSHILQVAEARSTARKGVAGK